MSAAHDIVARHRLTDAEYDALKARLAQVGEAERRSVLDVIVEQVIEASRHTDRQGKGKGRGIGPSTMAELLRAGTVVMDHDSRPDRVLATVLFTDVVDSTRHAAELGDRNWLELLERHDDLTVLRSSASVVASSDTPATARWPFSMVPAVRSSPRPR